MIYHAIWRRILKPFVRQNCESLRGLQFGTQLEVDIDLSQTGVAMATNWQQDHRSAFWMPPTSSAYDSAPFTRLATCARDRHARSGELAAWVGDRRADASRARRRLAPPPRVARQWTDRVTLAKFNSVRARPFQATDVRHSARMWLNILCFARCRRVASITGFALSYRTGHCAVRCRRQRTVTPKADDASRSVLATEIRRSLHLIRSDVAT